MRHQQPSVAVVECFVQIMRFHRLVDDFSFLQVGLGLEDGSYEFKDVRRAENIQLRLEFPLLDHLDVKHVVHQR